MDTLVKFEPAGKAALVAAGQTILGAARSLGVEIPAECGGLGQCDSCVVIVEAGAMGLSDLTDGERTYLNPERLSAGQRLACQAKLDGPEVTLRVPPVVKKSEPQEEPAPEKEAEAARRDPRIEQLRAEFGQLPFDRKVAALAELSLETASGVVDELIKSTQRLGAEVSSIFREPQKTKPPAPTEPASKSPDATTVAGESGSPKEPQP